VDFSVQNFIQIGQKKVENRAKFHLLPELK